MSKSVQARANLQSAKAVNTSRFKTKVHAFPEFKAWLDDKLDNGIDVKNAYSEAVNRWGRDMLPSRATVYNYVEKYYKAQREPTKTVTIVPKIHQLTQEAKDYDAYSRLLELGRLCGKRYNRFFENEAKMAIPFRSLTEIEKSYLTVLTQIVEFEIKLGIREGLITPTVGTMNIGGTHVTGDIRADLNTIDAATLSNLDDLIKFRKEAEDYAKAHADEAPAKGGDAKDGESAFSVLQSNPVGLQEQLAS